MDQADVGGHLQSSARVIAGAIPYQDGLHVRRKRSGEHAKKGVDRLGVEVRRQDPFGLSRCGAGGGDHVEIVVLRLLYRGGACTTLGPDPRQRPLLAEPRLVLEEDFDALFRIGLAEGSKLFGQFAFLKSSCRPGSASACRGRGTNEE